jgi:hypothetical protein
MRPILSTFFDQLRKFVLACYEDNAKAHNGNNSMDASDKDFNEQAIVAYTITQFKSL